MNFVKKDTVIYSITTNGTCKDYKVAAFDLDYTIIKTKSGKVFPKDANDWVLWNDRVKSVLYDYYNNCYKIVIFTNQRKFKDDFITKIEAIKEELKIDFDIFIATGDDYYRKPMTGMWDLFVSLFPHNIDIKHSFYCGDAAGRNSDFDIVDLYFAHNIGIKFEIPENIFGTKTIKYSSKSVYDSELDLTKLMKCKNTIKIKKYADPTMIIMVGRAGSGKSLLAQEIVKKGGNKMVYINRDTCKTQTACIKMIKESIKNGQSMVIDNTNPDKKSRQTYIELAKDNGMKVVVYKMDISEALSKHLNHMRVMTDHIDKVPEVAYRVYNKKYEEPSIDEGIDEIINVPFIYKGINHKYFNYFYSF